MDRIKVKGEVGVEQRITTAEARAGRKDKWATLLWSKNVFEKEVQKTLKGS